MENRLPTGPGSRGGSWHLEEFRRAYHRAWRAAHPDYRERERARRHATRAGASERQASSRAASFTDTLLMVLAEDVTQRGASRVAADLCVSHRTVGRWVRRERGMDGYSVDAIVALYGAAALAAVHGIALDEAVERRLAAGAAANFRGRNQYTRHRARASLGGPADIATPNRPRPLAPRQGVAA